MDTISKKSRKSRLSGIDRAACLRIVPDLGIISRRDTKGGIRSCQTVTVCRIDKAVWKTIINQGADHCVYNWTGDRKTVKFVTADAGKSVTAHEVINSTCLYITV